MTLLDDARAMQDDLVALRHDLHAIPEVGLQLPATQARVLRALEGLGLEITLGRDLTSVVAVLRGGRSTGRAVLLRSDMDALPVVEETGLDHASTNGAMHACGHDLHTTVLAGAARLLAAHRDDLDGDVVFMFQPGEEGHDGAARMIDEGVLDAAGVRPVAAYFVHVSATGHPFGTLVVRPGPTMASADTLHVTVRGAGGHGSAPHTAKDPIVVAAELVVALQTMVTRRFDVFDPVVLTVGTFHGGTAHNVIPAEATFQATVRTFTPETRAAVEREAVRLCRGLVEAHGLTADVEWETVFPPTVNDDDEAEFLRVTAVDVLGGAHVELAPNPDPGSEDFSRVLESVPGAMAFLSAVPVDADHATAAGNHSPLAVFDDDVLVPLTALYARLATDRLRAAARG